MNSFGVDLAQSAAGARQGFVEALPYFLLVGVIAVLSWYQQKQIMGRNAGAEVSQQQRMMMRIGPLMYVFFAFVSPAAIGIYFLVSTLWRVGQQHYITRSLYHGEDSVGVQAQKAMAELREAKKKASVGQGWWQRQEAAAPAQGREPRAAAPSERQRVVGHSPRTPSPPTRPTAGAGASGAETPPPLARRRRRGSRSWNGSSRPAGPSRRPPRWRSTSWASTSRTPRSRSCRTRRRACSAGCVQRRRYAPGFAPLRPRPKVDRRDRRAATTGGGARATADAARKGPGGGMGRERVAAGVGTTGGGLGAAAATPNPRAPVTAVRADERRRARPAGVVRLPVPAARAGGTGGGGATGRLRRQREQR